MLNLFAYTCGVGLSAAAGGAREVCNLDFAEGNLAVGRENGLLNPHLPTMQFVQSDYFPAIRQLAGLPIAQRRGQKLPSYQRLEQRQYDLVLLDPPAWAKSAFGTVDLLRDYQSLLKPALLTTAEDGVLICCNNLAKVSLDDWREQVLRCAEQDRPPGARLPGADPGRRLSVAGSTATAENPDPAALMPHSQLSDNFSQGVSDWIRNQNRVPYSKALRFRQMETHMHKGLIRAIGALLTALALYSLLGFLILPGIALRVTNQQLANYATVPAHLDRMELNPFSLEVTLWGLNIGEPGKEQVGFARLYANLQIDSLWTKALHLSDIELDKPKTELLFAKDGTLNLAWLVQAARQRTAPRQPQMPTVSAAHRARSSWPTATCTSKTCAPASPSSFSTTHSNFELKNLSTLPEDNADMTLVAAGPNGGQIDWVGQHQPCAHLTSEGTLESHRRPDESPGGPMCATRCRWC